MVASVALPVVVLLGCVVVCDQWVRVVLEGIERASRSADAEDDTGSEDGTEPGTPDESPQPEESEGAVDPAIAAAKKYRAAGRPARAGVSSFRITRKPDYPGYWVLTAEHRWDLSHDDPMTADLRRGEQRLVDWLPFSVSARGVYGTCEDLVAIGDVEAEELRQSPKEETSQAFLRTSAPWTEEHLVCSPEVGRVVADVEITLDVRDDMLGQEALYDRWGITFDAGEYSIAAVRGGTTSAQSGNRVEMRLSAKDTTRLWLWSAENSDIQPSDGDEIAVLAEVLQYRPSALREQVCLLLAVTAVGVCAVLFVRRWAPAATRGRWTVATVAGIAVTCALLLVTLSFGPDWWEDLIGRDVPLTVWWWVLLPFVVAALAVRVGTERPPSARQLLPVLLPSVVLLAPVVTLAWTSLSLSALLPAAVAVALAGGIGYALRRGLYGVPGRRWAVTAAAGIWLAVMSAGPGAVALPPLKEFGATSDPWGPSARAVAFFLAWVWPAALWAVLVALGRRTLFAAVVSGALWWTLAREYPPLAAAGGYDPADIADVPLALIQTSMLLAVLLLLWTHGRERAGWPRHLPTVVAALGIAALTTGLTLEGFAALTGDSSASGRYLAVAVAALGFAWLLPWSAEDRAVRLHRTPPAAHNRRMHALLKDQELAAGRREFLTASRTELAEGSLTPRAWSRRWRELGALGPRGTAPQHSVALRLAALGTSGGTSAWRNGIAGAALLAVLNLPWFVYTLPPRIVTIGYAASDVVEVWSTALRWPIYGFIYGYAYSWLRGGSPIGKALCLLAVVLPAEVVQLLYRGLEPRDFGTALVLTGGDCLAVCLILGLYWEARLVRFAGLRWGQIRNFRSLSAAAVPATTVLVAASTALATAVVGVWVAPNLDAPADRPQDQPSVSGSPTPGGDNP